MTVIRPPKGIDARVRQFCASITRRATPQYVGIAPREGCLPLECFANVRAQVEREGGRIQFGWTIWEWTGIFLEAEHHAVYDPGDHRGLIDVTPAQDGETRRLFLPDDDAIYDFDNEGTRIDNIRHALRKDPLIEAFFATAAEKSAFLNTVPGFGMFALAGEKAEQYNGIEGGWQDFSCKSSKNTPVRTVFASAGVGRSSNAATALRHRRAIWLAVWPPIFSSGPCRKRNPGLRCFERSIHRVLRDER